LRTQATDTRNLSSQKGHATGSSGCKTVKSRFGDFDGWRRVFELLPSETPSALCGYYPMGPPPGA
jgi:hypothetical protein